jgi:hypothetical protein
VDRCARRAAGFVGRFSAAAARFHRDRAGLRFKNACPDTFAAEGLGATKFGGQDAFVAVASCGKVDQSSDKHSETALIVAIKGRADYYTVQWAERTGPSGKPAIDAAKWQARLRQLQPIRLCPIEPGETAPYPSCVGKN